MTGPIFLRVLTGKGNPGLPSASHLDDIRALLDAWARWRLTTAGAYPPTSPLYRAGLAMPRSPNRPGSRPPAPMDHAEDVVQVQRLLVWLAEAGHALEVEAITATYIGEPGERTSAQTAERLGISVEALRKRRQTGLTLLSALWRWSAEVDHQAA